MLCRVEDIAAPARQFMKAVLAARALGRQRHGRVRVDAQPWQKRLQPRQRVARGGCALAPGVAHPLGGVAEIAPVAAPAIVHCVQQLVSQHVKHAQGVGSVRRNKDFIHPASRAGARPALPDPPLSAAPAGPPAADLYVWGDGDSRRREPPGQMYGRRAQPRLAQVCRGGHVHALSLWCGAAPRKKSLI